MTNTYKLSVDDIKRVSTDYSNEFALAKIAVLSTKPNSHKIPITDKILRESGDTIRGKWVIAEYDKWKHDVTTHTPDTKIIGIIPKDTNIEYVVDENGDTTMYVDAVISKLYATDVYDLFVKDNFRNVSVEMTVKAKDENYDNGIDGIIFYAVCVLGKDVRGSCPNANMEIIRFSEKEADTFYTKKKSIWDNYLKGEVLMSKQKENEDIVMEEQKDEKLESATEETMAEKTEEPTSDEPKEDEKMAEPTEEEPKDEPNDEGEVKASEEEVKASCGEDEKLGCGEKMEDDKSDDDDNEDKDEDHNEKMAELEAKLAETEAKLSEKDETITKMQEQIDELVKFKSEKEEAEKMSIVTATLAQVKDCMAEADYTKFEESGKICKLEDITAWKNEVLANVATVLMSEKEKEDDGITRMSLPTEPEKPKDAWEKYIN